MTQKATNDKITAIRNAAMSAKPVIKAEPQVKGDEEPLSVNAHGRHIFMHISGIDIKMLSAAWTPKYYSDSAGRRRFHILRKDRFMHSSSVIEQDDYTVFAENGRILLQKVS